MLIKYFSFILAEIVAQFKYTVLLMPSGANLVTDLQFQPEIYESEHSVTDPDLKVSLFLLTL